MGLTPSVTRQGTRSGKTLTPLPILLLLDKLDDTGQRSPLRSTCVLTPGGPSRSSLVDVCFLSGPWGKMLELLLRWAPLRHCVAQQLPVATLKVGIPMGPDCSLRLSFLGPC